MPPARRSHRRFVHHYRDPRQWPPTCGWRITKSSDYRILYIYGLLTEESGRSEDFKSSFVIRNLHKGNDEIKLFLALDEILARGGSAGVHQMHRDAPNAIRETARAPGTNAWKEGTSLRRRRTALNAASACAAEGKGPKNGVGANVTTVESTKQRARSSVG